MWYDEDLGYNTGKIKVLNGHITDIYTPDGGSNEAYKLIAEIDPYMKDYIEEVLTDLNKEE
jgi:hypothetical protein